MSIAIDFVTMIYVACAVALAIFTSGIWVLLILWGRHRNDVLDLPEMAVDDWPRVTVQLPIYNEYAVVERLLRAVTGLDYPRDKLSVQVLDDSDDETGALTAALVKRYRRSGLNITHIQRAEQAGYKAGALENGLTQTDDELIAVFDADFVPLPDFLRRTAPYFHADPQLGIVQCRWAHLNAGQNMMTRSQAMSIDGHFVVEQTARNRGGLLLSFNGTGGVWRQDCIHDAGGWSGDTIAEDLDLSYRAQMRGWRYLYLPDVAVPAEIPPQVAAYKRQQARWAKGTTQNLKKLSGALWRNPNLNLLQKFMGTLHLCQYLPHPLILLFVLLTPPLLLAGALDKLPLAPLGLIGIGPPLMYVLSQRRLYRDWPRRLLFLPLLLAIGGGMVLNNSVAVLETFTRRPSVFKRTPKFSGQVWHQSSYALRPDWTTVGEFLLALYVAGGGIIALRVSPGIAPFLFMQSYGFAAMVLWSVLEEVQIKRNIARAREQQVDGRQA